MTKFAFQRTESRFSFQEDNDDNTGGVGDLPGRLKRASQWLVTHDTPWNEERHKSPKYPSEGWNSGDLLSFDEAQRRFEQDDDIALAFRFTEDGPFVGFDLDDVTGDGAFTDEALEIVRRLGSYTEVSTSGNGLHIIAEGEHVDDRKNRGDLSNTGHIEVYDESRYFVLTGDVHDGYSSVKKRPTVVQELQENHLPETRTFAFAEEQQSANHQQESREGDTQVTPEQVRETIRVYGESYKSSVDAEPVLRMWDGSDADYGGDTSRADMAFVKQLYYWCGGDERLMDDCFRASGRMRDKWDEVHTSDGMTYGEMTINKVCSTNHQTFGGDYLDT